jgi:uncharacterized protein (DUF362 family)
MALDRLMNRRESLQQLGRLTLAVSAAAVFHTPFNLKAAVSNERFLVEAVGQTDGYSVKELVRKTFDAGGGIGKFVAKGDVVALKPNIAWARRPELAATTNPEILEAVIELCQEAGAKTVRIMDNTMHDARRCFAITGAGMVAKKTGADLVFPRSSVMKEMNLRGNRLGVWPVFAPLMECDTLINIPVAKHHSLTGLTIGMKNWIGGVDGSRWKLHQDIHQSIVDLAQFFKPKVTLVDAIRIMTRNGPSGGSTDDVAQKNTLILSDDPVAADGRAALLFGRQPEDIGFIRLGQKSGLGTYEFQLLNLKQVTL